MKRTLDPVEKQRRQQWRDALWVENKTRILSQEAFKKTKAPDEPGAPANTPKKKTLSVATLAAAALIVGTTR